MSTYILMKILESAPSRYDRGIRILTFGRINKAYDQLTSDIKNGQTVLDIGCGTGALTIRAARKGASVKGIDTNPEMLAIAKKRIQEAQLESNVTFHEMGVAELDQEASQYYDVVMSGFCFSELTDYELTYTLKEVQRILKPAGLLFIADETEPTTVLKRILNGLIRLPLIPITYLFTQTTTHPVKALPDKLKESGLFVESIQLNKLENFIELKARRYDGAT